jgi:hypothetical protein
MPCGGLYQRVKVSRWHSSARLNPPPPSVGYHDLYKLLGMTDSSSIDNDLVSLAPTAASILGIKGSLRFRLHGSSQKAHVVLRRVEPESDSEGEGETKGVAQFSLFAYKRIEVKPGKEILLTVADGPFKDRAIIFEGDELEPSSLSDVEEETQIAEDDDNPVPTDYSLPLKMRKPWAKRLEVSGALSTCDTPSLSFLQHSPALQAPASLPKVTRQSIGVQTDPVKLTGNAPSLLPAPPAHGQVSQTVSPRVPGVSKSVPSMPLHVPVSAASVSDIKPNVTVPHPTRVTQPKVAAVSLRRHRDHIPLPIKIDSTTDNSIPSSTGNTLPIPSTPEKREDTTADVCANLEESLMQPLMGKTDFCRRPYQWPAGTLESFRSSAHYSLHHRKTSR